MDVRNHHAAFADRGGDAFDGRTANVTGGKDSREARLEWIGFPRETPILDFASRTNVAMLVALQRFGQPIGFRVGADENEQRVRGALLLGARRAATSDDLLQTSLPGDRFERR